MNLKELSSAYYLQKEIKSLSQKVDKIIADIEQEKIRLADLREQSISVGSPSLSGMPRSTTVSSYTEDITVRIMACEEAIQSKVLFGMQLMDQIAQKRNDAIQAKMKIDEYIGNIKSWYLQEVFDLRFLQGYTWPAVAENMSSGTDDAESIKKMCYRYIKRHSK